MNDEYMNVAEQEHADHVLGSASEFQNCFSEAGMRRGELAADASVEINAALDAGKFVVVEEVAYYCKATDACAGIYRVFRAAFETRESADTDLQARYDEIQAGCGDHDAHYQVLPLAPRYAPAVTGSDSDVPF